jgi:dTMP kinase
VVFEGAEGVGKSTQVAALFARAAVAGVPLERYREPGATPLGERVRALVLDPGPDMQPAAEALLFMAARAQLVALVRARLAGGVSVVLDRFFLSTYAYQVAGRGLPADGVRAANALATGGLVPDLTVLLTCDPSVSAARVASRGELDRMEQAGGAFHARVADAFARAAHPAWQAAHPEVGPIVAVDAVGTPGEVEARVASVLADRLPETFGGLRESNH